MNSNELTTQIIRVSVQLRSGPPQLDLTCSNPNQEKITLSLSRYWLSSELLSIRIALCSGIVACFSGFGFGWRVQVEENERDQTPQTHCNSCKWILVW